MEAALLEPQASRHFQHMGCLVLDQIATVPASYSNPRATVPAHSAALPNTPAQSRTFWSAPAAPTTTPAVSSCPAESPAALQSLQQLPELSAAGVCPGFSRTFRTRTWCGCFRNLPEHFPSPRTCPRPFPRSRHSRYATRDLFTRKRGLASVPHPTLRSRFCWRSS